MKIERILRKDENNVAVFLDNHEKLILSVDVFYESGLRKGDEISDDRFSFFIEQNILYHIKRRALLFIGRRFHSEKELLLKLKARSYEERLIRKVLSDLTDKGFINDRVFAEHFIEEKTRKKKWGKNKIKSALFSRGISSSLIDEVISLKFPEVDDTEMAMELAGKKLLQLQKRNTDPNKYYQKISTFLLSRGIDYETCREVCLKILKD